MIVEVGGGKGGLKEYLETGQKKGRDLHRDQLDQRIPLAGDLDVFEFATSIHGGGGHKYDHITLSFSENYVSDEMLQVAVDEFREHALAAWPESERHRIAFYAEAHRPKILSYINSETGEEVGRCTHIHIGIGRHDTETGKSIEPLGFLGPQSDNLKYIDAWQESFNARHGFSSPKDNPKITPENAVDVLARYTGNRPDALGTTNEKKAFLEVVLQKEILARNITTWEDFGSLLAEHGVVNKMREGKFNECYRIKPDGADRAMRLKGVFFQRQFIERPTSEKTLIISDKAKVAYLEQMQPRKEPAYLAAMLGEWSMVKARENRYLHTGDKFYKNVYSPADAETRLHILDGLERESNGIASPAANQNRKIATARSRVPRMPVRNLDGIQIRSEMLLRRHSGVDVRADAAAEPNGFSMRQTDAGDRTGDSHPGQHISSWQSGSGRSSTGANGSREGLSVVGQPSSVLARLDADLRERYEQAADKDRYSEIARYLDCGQLLSSLSHTHGLNPALYQVATAKDGAPRIQCGSRALSPSDFLTKEIGLPWKEAAPILRRVYEHQIGNRHTTPRLVQSAPSPLWREFKADQLAGKDARAEQLTVFDEETAQRRASLFAALKSQQAKALDGLSGAARKTAQSLEKLRAATVKADFTDERRAARKSIVPTQAAAWRQFLQARAQAGNEEALVALRKLNDEARAAPAQSITGTIYLDDDESVKRRRHENASILRTLTHVVQRNGDVTYRQHGHAVLRDEGRHLAVLDENNEDAIVVGLLLAREKFGTNLTLTGSSEFQRRVVAVAVAHGIHVKFVDPRLDAIRQQLVDDKYKPTRITAITAPATPADEAAAIAHQVAPTPPPAPSLTQSKKSAQRAFDLSTALDPHQVELAAPAPEAQHQSNAPIRVAQKREATSAPTEPQNPLQPAPEAPAVALPAEPEIPARVETEIEPEPKPMSAHDWLAQWAADEHKAIAPATAESGQTEYRVIYIAPDGVVLNKGRSGAVYPVPAGKGLQVDDNVVVNRDGQLCAPPEPEIGKNERGR